MARTVVARDATESGSDGGGLRNGLQGERTTRSQVSV